MSDTFATELLREMENAIPTSEDEETGTIDVKYDIIAGFRVNSQLMWAYEENQLYYENSYSKKTKLKAYTCRIKGCPARVYVREDRSAFRDREIKHLSSHGSQYQEYKFMYCDNRMKDRAKSASASMTPYDIYMEVIAEYVVLFIFHLIEN